MGYFIIEANSAKTSSTGLLPSTTSQYLTFNRSFPSSYSRNSSKRWRSSRTSETLRLLKNLLLGGGAGNFSPNSPARKNCNSVEGGSGGCCSSLPFEGWSLSTAEPCRGASFRCLRGQLCGSAKRSLVLRLGQRDICCDQPQLHLQSSLVVPSEL